MTAPMSEGELRAALDTWAIVEMFGHKKLAGKVTEHAIGSASLIRVDVPETDQGGVFTKPYTKLVGPGSIYCITPCSEAVGRAAAQRIERYNEPIPVDISVPRQLAPTTSDAEIIHDDGGDDADDDNDERRGW